MLAAELVAALAAAVVQLWGHSGGGSGVGRGVGVGVGGGVGSAPKARIKPHAVHCRLVCAGTDGDGVPRGVDELVPLAEVVAVGGLVKHVRDDAVQRRSAERIVRSLVGKPAGREHTNVLGLYGGGGGEGGG